MLQDEMVQLTITMRTVQAIYTDDNDAEALERHVQRQSKEALT